MLRDTFCAWSKNRALPQKVQKVDLLTVSQDGWLIDGTSDLDHSSQWAEAYGLQSTCSHKSELFFRNNTITAVWASLQSTAPPKDPQRGIKGEKGQYSR